METATMGKVLVTATIENLEDLFNAEKGALPRDQVRRIEVADALVDTGATTLMLPERMIATLGLRPTRTRQTRGIGGTVPLTMYSAVRLTIQGRDCTLDVGEISDDLPVIIGQVPLELLDWVVDLKGQRLIGNPEHGGEHMMDAFPIRWGVWVARCHPRGSGRSRWAGPRSSRPRGRVRCTTNCRSSSRPSPKVDLR